MIVEHTEGVKIVSSRHTCNKNHHERYNKTEYSNVLFDYKKNDIEKHSLWYKLLMFGQHREYIPPYIYIISYNI
jgi:hypothetical protein